MTAQIIDFASAVARRGEAAGTRRTASQTSSAALNQDFTFWMGISGAPYVHTIYGLIECPEIPNANIVFVRRDPATGVREALHIGRVEHAAPSLNLAEIRHRGATLGANEVHVHLLGKSEAARAMIERDLLIASQEGGLTRSAS
jgi:hypothetical protein